MSSPVNRRSGFALIELMIAMVLGLLLMTGAIQVMLSSKQTFSANEDSSRTQENGRFALDLLIGDVRMAGFRDPANGDIPSFFLTDACDTLNPCTSNGVTVASDRLAVQFDPDDDLDCVGNAVAATDLLAHVYAIVSANGINSLTCRSWNVTTNAWVSAVQPLIDGIDNMQILYGTTVGTDTSITQYVSADRVADWTMVRAVRIGLLVSDGRPNGQSDNRRRDYVLLDSPTLSFTDSHMRRIYGTTVNINNAFTAE